MGARDAANVLSEDYSDFDDENATVLERSVAFEIVRAKPTAPNALERIEAIRRPPHNIEAEQALLGAILVENEALNCVSGFLSPDQFFDPLHARIYETLVTLIHAGKTATPITVKTFFENVEPINASMTVPQYLGRLAANATTIINAAEYGRTIHDLATRRALILIGEDLAADAYDIAVARPAADLLAEIERKTEDVRKGTTGQFRIAPPPYRYVPPESIPKRPVLYGQEIRGQVGATVGRPGVGKTKITIIETLAKVTGKKLLHDTPNALAPLTCWVHFGEEEQDEIDRLITAAMDHHGLTVDDVGDRLFITNRTTKLIVATADRDGLVIAAPVIKEVKRFISDNHIDSFTIDPFVKSHTAPENDNGMIDQVVGVWSDIAYETRAAGSLSHHTRKTGGAPITIDDVRGGSAIVGALRSVRLLNTMSAEEAAKAGIDKGDAWKYIKVDDGKQNNLPPASARWVYLLSRSLASDEVAGVATAWKWPDPFNGVKTSDLLKVQKIVDGGSFRKSDQANDWVGNAVAEAMGWDVSKEKRRIRAMIKTWIENGALKIVSGLDKSRQQRLFVEVGTWARE